MRCSWIHTVFSLQRTKLGFDVRGLYGVSFPLAKGEATQAGAYAATLRERISRVPGVEGVTEGTLRYFTALSAYETRIAAPSAMVWATPTCATFGGLLHGAADAARGGPNVRRRV